MALSRWLRGRIAANEPYDRFVRAILTAEGPVGVEGPAAVYKTLDGAEVAARSLSQVFLGVRIECAQCHHHPSEKWSQDDYAALAGFFTGVKVKALPGGGEAVVSRAPCCRCAGCSSPPTIPIPPSTASTSARAPRRTTGRV